MCEHCEEVGKKVRYEHLAKTSFAGDFMIRWVPFFIHFYECEDARFVQRAGPCITQDVLGENSKELQNLRAACKGRYSVKVRTGRSTIPSTGKNNVSTLNRQHQYI